MDKLSDMIADDYVPLTFDQWKLKYRPTPAPSPTKASQTSKRTRSSRRRQLDPDEKLSLVKLALEYADILRYEHDPRAYDIAVTLAFEKKHGSGFRSVRSELLDMEKTWRSGPGHGYSYDLSFAIMQWSKIVDLERARKAEEMAERRIEREILGWDRDAVATQQDRKPEKTTSKLVYVYIAGSLLLLVWSILDSNRVDNKPVLLLNG